MKIYIDNECNQFRKIISVKTSYNEDIFDDIETVIDALKALGYSEETIQEGFIQKCVDWDIIGKIPEELE